MVKQSVKSINLVRKMSVVGGFVQQPGIKPGWKSGKVSEEWW